MKQKWHEAELEDLRKLKEEEDLKIQAQLRERERLKEAFDLELKRKEQNKLLEQEQKLRECEKFKAEQKKQMEAEIALWKEKQEQIRKNNIETARINEEAAKKR